jgi:hypothetical protein
VDEKETDGDDDQNDMKDYKRICTTRGIACQTGLARPRIGVNTGRIGPPTCSIGDDKLACI